MKLTTINELKKYFGKAKTRTTHEEERRIREDISKKFAGKFGIKLD